MALIECVECHGKVSDRAAACPHCGCPVVVSAEAAPRAPGAPGVDASAEVDRPPAVEPKPETPAWASDQEERLRRIEENKRRAEELRARREREPPTNVVVQNVVQLTWWQKRGLPPPRHLAIIVPFLGFVVFVLVWSTRRGSADEAFDGQEAPPVTRHEDYPDRSLKARVNDTPTLQLDDAGGPSKASAVPIPNGLTGEPKTLKARPALVESYNKAKKTYKPLDMDGTTLIMREFLPHDCEELDSRYPNLKTDAWRAGFAKIRCTGHNYRKGGDVTVVLPL